MKLKAKKKARGRNPDGLSHWEAKPGDLVEFTEDEAERRLRQEPKTWEVVKDGRTGRKKRKAKA